MSWRDLEKPTNGRCSKASVVSFKKVDWYRFPWWISVEFPEKKNRRPRKLPSNKLISYNFRMISPEISWLKLLWTYCKSWTIYFLDNHKTSPETWWNPEGMKPKNPRPSLRFAKSSWHLSQLSASALEMSTAHSSRRPIGQAPWDPSEALRSFVVFFCCLAKILESEKLLESRKFHSSNRRKVPTQSGISTDQFHCAVDPLVIKPTAQSLRCLSPSQSRFPDILTEFLWPERKRHRSFVRATM